MLPPVRIYWTNKATDGNPWWPIFLGVGSGCLQMFPHYSYGISKQPFPTGHETVLNTVPCAHSPCHRFQGRAGVNTGHQEMQPAREEGNGFSRTCQFNRSEKWVVEVNQGHVLETGVTENYEKKICILTLFSCMVNYFRI